MALDFPPSFSPRRSHRHPRFFCEPRYFGTYRGPARAKAPHVAIRRASGRPMSWFQRVRCYFIDGVIGFEQLCGEKVDHSAWYSDINVTFRWADSLLLFVGPMGTSWSSTNEDSNGLRILRIAPNFPCRENFILAVPLGRSIAIRRSQRASGYYL